MFTDFKYVRLETTGNGLKAIVRFYEGDITMEKELNGRTRKMELVTRYRRTSILGESQYEATSEAKMETLLRKELKKDDKGERRTLKRQPILEQI